LQIKKIFEQQNEILVEESNPIKDQESEAEKSKIDFVLRKLRDLVEESERNGGEINTSEISPEIIF